MNYMERMKEYLKEPDENSHQWGRWGILNKEQRTLIKRLLREMDSADEVIKHQYFEIERLKNIIDKLEIEIEIGTGKYAYDTDYTRGLSDAFIYMNDRLKELKGDGSNE